MEIMNVCVLLCVFCTALVRSEGINSTFLEDIGNITTNAENNQFNRLFDGISLETLVPRLLGAVTQVYTVPSSPRCTLQRLAVLKGLAQRQLWAITFFDAMGKPGNGILQGNTRLMGNYDQCRSISGVTDLNQVIQGVFVEFTFRLQLPAGVPSASGIFPNQDTGLPVLLWGVCLPAVCDLQDATVIGKKIAESLNMTHSGSFLFEDKEPLKDTCFIIAIVVFGVLGCFCFIGTIIDVFVVNKRCKKDKKKGRTQKTDAGSDAQETQGQGDNSMGTEDSRVSSAPKLEPHYTSIREGSGAEGVGSKDVPDGGPDEKASVTKKIGIAGRFFLAFSISTNLQEILAAKHSPSDIHCLHGIKVMSISWVILGHVFFLTPHFANLLTVNDMSKWWSFQGITNGVFAVDTFFLISGCLVAYLFLKTARRAGGLKWKHMVLYYVHRYLRITPLFALAMLFYTGITPYLESGPFAREAHDRDVVCRDTWWANILYITNLLDDPNACINWSWYLPNDMQFYVIAPLALIPMALGQRVIGLLVTFLLVACHFTTNAILQNKLHTSIYRNVDKLVPNIYIKPWTRVGPYAIGIILGFILFQTKCKARLKKVYVFLGWLISAAGALTIVYISYDNVKDYGIAKATWSYLSADVYETVKIPVWSLCVGWVIFACASGYGGFVNSFLSWPAWIPLSRLALGTYLVHLMVMMYFNNNARTVEYFTYNLVLERYVSVFIISNALSLILSLLIETPVRNLIKPSKKPPANSTATLPDTQHKNQISRSKSTTHETSFMPVKSFGPDVTDGTAVVLTEIRELQQQTSHPATGRRLSSRHEGYSNDGFLSENPYVDISPIKGLHNLRSINK